MKSVHCVRSRIGIKPGIVRKQCPSTTNAVESYRRNKDCKSDTPKVDNGKGLQLRWIK